MITRLNFRIFQIHPIHDFFNFPKNGLSDNGCFNEKFKKSYIGWIRKNLGIHAGKSLLWFSIKNDNLGLKLMFWNFLEFSLTTNPCLVWPHMTPPWPKKDSFAVKPSRNSFTPFCNFTDKKNGLNLTKIRYQGHMTIKIYDLSGWWKFVKIWKITNFVLF